MNIWLLLAGLLLTGHTGDVPVGSGIIDGMLDEPAHADGEIGVPTLPDFARPPAPEQPVEGSETDTESDRLPAGPDEPEAAALPGELPEVVVVGERPLSAASDTTVRNRDFMNFPRRTASDLLRFVPGLHITQHTGGAKAHQIFLRGFDAEHGQDIGAFLDGIPLNEPSHVHGQGYLDLHFLIPETIERIWVMKGPYDPRYGDFTTAGVIDFRPFERRPATWSAAIDAGSGTTLAGLGTGSFDWPGMATTLALQAERTDGFTDPGRAAAGRAFLTHRIDLSGGLGLKLLYAGYLARSEAADILPVEWIEAGRIGRFEALDDSNRVDADRHLAGAALDWQTSNQTARLQGYYDFKRTLIFSNYTFYYFEPEQGDQIEQRDRRHRAGIRGFYRRLDRPAGIELSTEAGVSFAADLVGQLQSRTVSRRPYDQLSRYDFVQSSAGVYLDERIEPVPWLRLIAGVRLDAVRYDGSGEQDRKELDIQTNRVVVRQDSPVGFGSWAWAVSPKLSAIVRAGQATRLFLNFGRGFVSTQARQQAWEPDPTMPAVTAGELGARIGLWGERLAVGLSAWAAHKEAESVFDSEFGTSLLRGQSLRLGADLEIRLAPLPWLYIGTDLYWVRARFVDGWQPIPNMADWLMTNVASVRHPSGISGTLRGRFIGPRIHDLGYRSDPYYLIDAQIGWSRGPFSVALMVENLLDVAWYDSVYAFPSRPEKGGEVIEGLHATPGGPVSARLHLEIVY